MPEKTNKTCQSCVYGPKKDQSFYTICHKCQNHSEYDPFLYLNNHKENQLSHDHHYAQQNIQPIEYMKSTLKRHDGFTGFCLGNIIKYASRFGLKDDKEKELDKIIDYAQRLKSHITGKQK